MTDYHARFVELSRQLEPHLSQESFDEIARYLDHHENSLALEAMVIEICRMGKVPVSLDRERIRVWMQKMELDTEPALEEGVYERFTNLP